MFIAHGELISSRELTMQVDFIEFNEKMLRKTYEWLQDEELCHLIDTTPVSLEKQKAWFESLKNRKDYYIKGIVCDSIPIGAVGIKHISSNTGEYWGYIGNKEFWGKGIGKEMVSRMLLDAKEIYKLSTLKLRVREDNMRAFRLYQSMGFVELKKSKDFIEMEFIL